MTEELKVPIGPEEARALAGRGDDVVYVADVALFRCMEFRRLERGMALVRLDTGEFEVFDLVEISTPEVVARVAARGLDDDAAAAAAA